MQKNEATTSSQHDAKLPVISRSFPQPKEIDAWLLEKLKHKRIDDEFGFTGEYRLCQNDLIDFLIDVQNGL